MELSGKIQLLEQAVVSEKGLIRFSLLLAILVLFFSVGGAVVVNKLTPDSVKLPLTISTALVSFASGFPLKDLYSRKNKIVFLNFLKTQYQQIQNNPSLSDELQMTELEKRFWTLCDKNM